MSAHWDDVVALGSIHELAHDVFARITGKDQVCDHGPPELDDKASKYV